MVKVAPSLLSADFSKLQSEIEMMEQAKAEYIHFDVMDGMFVPNISFGIPVLKSLKAKTDIPFDVHLMIEKPERYIQEFSDAGADLIVIHIESTYHAHRCIQMIKACGKKAGVALNPHTPIETIKHLLKEVDLVLLMSVNPGYGGQKLIEEVLEKGKKLRAYAKQIGAEFELEIDGGVNTENARTVESYGFDVMVAGSAVFGAKDSVKAIREIRGNEK